MAQACCNFGEERCSIKWMGIELQVSKVRGELKKWTKLTFFFLQLTVLSIISFIQKSIYLLTYSTFLSVCCISHTQKRKRFIGHCVRVLQRKESTGYVSPFLYICPSIHPSIYPASIHPFIPSSLYPSYLTILILMHPKEVELSVPSK